MLRVLHCCDRTDLNTLVIVSLLSLAGITVGFSQESSKRASLGTHPASDPLGAVPVLAWDFDDLSDLDQLGPFRGKVNLGKGPDPTTYPTFSENGRALHVPFRSYLRIPEEELESDLDFDDGDVITVEAWVQIDSIQDNAYIIGKGRSGTKGLAALDQNWAFRLRQQGGVACLNFLFRSRDQSQHSVEQQIQKGGWHRWTSSTGFGTGPFWHHVAISYQFGKPDSIKAYLDGQPVSGKWDMNGPTNRPPVVNDSDIWIGSSMNGSKGNSFDGAIDELRVYRDRVPAETLVKRFEYHPETVKPPEWIGPVTYQLFGPFGDYKNFPLRTGECKLAWDRPALAFSRLPNNYDDSGVIDDWTTAKLGSMLVRGWANITLEPGDYQFLVRSRGRSRLFLDGEELLSTPAQRGRGNAHNLVDPIPDVPVAGMRPHYMNDHERIAAFHSTGGSHLVRFDSIVGAQKFTLRVGETCVAVAKLDGSGEPGMFRLLSPEPTIPLSDDGWAAYTEEENLYFDQNDRSRRARSAEQQDAYWDRRHHIARRQLTRATDDQRSIDEIIHARIEDHNATAGSNAILNAKEAHYLEKVAPILQRHCSRCHGDKRQGDLSVLDRASLLAGGESGEKAIDLTQWDASQLWQLVSAASTDYRMPPEGPGLSDQELGHVRRWLKHQAPMPAAPKSMIHVPPPVEDLAYLRRVYLDCVGVFPTTEEIGKFLALPTEVRYERTVDRLLADDRWADHWVSYWQDAFAENPNLLKPTLNNTGPFRFWIHDALIDNKPLDRFASELIMMRGSKWYGGAAGFSVASQNDAPMAAKAHVLGNSFLGVEMKCARCHDAPYHDWNQSDLFQIAAMLERKPILVPESSTVPAAFFESRTRNSLISATLKQGDEIDSKWPLEDIQADFDQTLLRTPKDPREQLAVLITSSRRFAEVMANRIWARLMGAGVVEPVHDWHGNLPSDPELLARLADLLIEVDYDSREFSRHILLSDAYRRSCSVEDPERFFAGPLRRRMTAEQIVDASLKAVGQEMRTEMLTLDVEGDHKPDFFFNFGYPKRAWEFTTLANERDRPSLALPRAQAVADVLKAFGWRNSRPEPVSQREEAPNLVQPGALANGTFGIWLTRLTDESELTQLMLEAESVDYLVDELFLRILTRYPDSGERQKFSTLLQDGFESRKVPSKEMALPETRKRYPYVSWSNHLNTEANKIKLAMEADARRGDPPTRYLKDAWRLRAEDAIWALVNSPEMVVVP